MHDENDTPQGQEPAISYNPQTGNADTDSEKSDRENLAAWQKEQAEYDERKKAHVANLRSKWDAAKGGLHSGLREFLEALLASHLGAFEDN